MAEEMEEGGGERREGGRERGRGRGREGEKVTRSTIAGPSSRAGLIGRLAIVAWRMQAGPGKRSMYC